MDVSPKLIKPQAEFVNLDVAFPAFIGGFGSGKTWAGCSKLLKSAWEFPRVPLGYFGPTYGDIKHIFFPTIEECAATWGLNIGIRTGDFEVDLFNGRTYRATIICRSMKNASDIRGFKIGRGLVDEIDTLKPSNAADAWRKIIARRRFKFKGSGWIGITTTPEGFGFAWQSWEKDVRDDIVNGSKRDLASKYQLVRASTYENEINLQDDYIESLLASYPENLIQAYLHGLFVNLTHGSVYRQFDRKLNGSSETVQKDDVLFVGMDFNVGKMAAVFHVKRDGNPHGVDEIVNAYDTPDMIRIIKERYWHYIDGNYRKTHEIRVYPDSSGGSRKSVTASETDIQLLKEAGFSVSAPPSNPPVKDRVNSLNAMICNAMGERRYRINVDKCPHTVECLEKQAYNDQGEPDKSSDLDHHPEAVGYFIHRDYPLRRPVTKLNIGIAM